MKTPINQNLLVIGYGSLLSGFGLLAERRPGRGRKLVAQSAFPVTLRNARRGLAKPSSHGDYLAMDLEPIDGARPITGLIGIGADGGIGALGLEFNISSVRLIAQREEYSPDKLVELIARAEDVGELVGDFLLRIAERSGFDLLEYRGELRRMLGYTSPGYVFHPLPLEDGRVALAAIGSGFNGSGDPAVRSRRNECGMDRLLTLAEALEVNAMELDRHGQLGYFVECLLGGWHGLQIGDLMNGFEPESDWGKELARLFMAETMAERGRFLTATTMDSKAYRGVFAPRPDDSLTPLLEVAKLGSA